MEYKTILLPVAVTKKQTAKIETILNETAEEGWDLSPWKHKRVWEEQTET